MKKKYVVSLFVALLLTGCAHPEPRIPPEGNPPAEHLTLASFNIRIFSNTSRDDVELATIADILQKYDLIAIQELRDEEVLKRTVVLLQQRGLGYSYEISPPVGRGVKERYAYLYRTDLVQPVQPGRIYQERGDEFIREPFYATFRSANFDFTLVTIHALFGSSEAERRPEIEELAAVYQAVQDEDPKEQDVILLGDFNFPPTDEGFSRLKAIPGMVFLVAPPVKTTITDTSRYDNFWFQKQYVREYAGESGVDRFNETMSSGDDLAAKRAVSDHRPIWAKFNVGGPDDD